MESNFKDEREYEIDSAVWYSEALANYNYGDVTNNKEGLDIDTSYISVALSSGKVTQTQLNSAFNKIIDTLAHQYNQLPANAQMIFVDVWSQDSTSGEVTFGFIGAFGYGSTLDYGPFNSAYDFWMFGWGQYNNGGYCDGPYSGTYINLDAAQQIEIRIRQDLTVPAQRNYATDLLTLLIKAPDEVRIPGDPNSPYSCDFENEDDTTQYDNLYDYLLLHKYYPWQNFEDCLIPNEMNFYWDGTDSVCFDLVYDCLGETLGERALTSISIIGDNSNTFPNYHYLHYLTNTYGIWIVNTNDPNTFD